MFTNKKGPLSPAVQV